MNQKMFRTTIAAALMLVGVASGAHANAVQTGAAAAALMDQALKAAEKIIDARTERIERQLERQRDCKRTTGDYGC